MSCADATRRHAPVPECRKIGNGFLFRVARPIDDAWVPGNGSTLALLIDGDNASPKIVAALLAEAAKSAPACSAHRAEVRIVYAFFGTSHQRESRRSDARPMNPPNICTL